jgi:hypothetical protein
MFILERIGWQHYFQDVVGYFYGQGFYCLNEQMIIVRSFFKYNFHINKIILKFW